MKKDILCTATGVMAAAGVKLFGGWTPTIYSLLVCMGIDLILGFIVAAVFHKSPKTENGGADSYAMFKGICRKFAMICVLALAHQLDVVIGVDYIMTASIYGFLANEAFSIVENAGLVGIIKSDALLSGIEILKKKGDSKKE